MKNFPQQTANKNVPAEACLICEYSQMSGEIVTTVFFSETGKLWSVTDWVNDKPHGVDPIDIARMMGVSAVDLYRAAIRYFDSPLCWLK